MKERIVFGANITGLEGGVICVDCATEGPYAKDTYILFELDRRGKVINPLLKVVIRDKGSEGVEYNFYRIDPNKIFSCRDVQVGSSASVTIKATAEKGVTFNNEKPPLYTDELKKKLFW